MMMDMFSCFDDHYINDYSFSLHLWFLNIFMVTGLVYYSVWNSSSNIDTANEILYDFVYFLMKSNSKDWSVSGFFLYMCGLFSLFLFGACSSMCPYSYSVCAHFSFSSFFALMTWSALVVSSACWHPFKFMQQAIPLNCPTPLVPILFVLEIVTSLMRPLTLTIRLCMNTIMGGIIINLISGASFSMLSKIMYFSDLLSGSGLLNSFFSFNFNFGTLAIVFISLVFTSIFIILEVVISFLQVFIFCMLCFLYEKDHTA